MRPKVLTPPCCRMPGRRSVHSVGIEMQDASFRSLTNAKAKYGNCFRWREVSLPTTTSTATRILRSLALRVIWRGDGNTFEARGAGRWAGVASSTTLFRIVSDRDGIITMISVTLTCPHYKANESVKVHASWYILTYLRLYSRRRRGCRGRNT